MMRARVRQRGAIAYFAIPSSFIAIERDWRGGGEMVHSGAQVTAKESVATREVPEREDDA